MELKIKLDEIDYGALAVRLLPMLPEEAIADSGLVSGFLLGSIKKQPGILKSIIDALPEEKKEEMVISLLSQNEGKLTGKLNELARQNGLPIKVEEIKLRK